MDSHDLQFYSLYVSRFAGGFGFSALALLLPKYANALDAPASCSGCATPGSRRRRRSSWSRWRGRATATTSALFLGLLAFGVVVSVAFVAVLVRSHGAEALTEW